MKQNKITIGYYLKGEPKQYKNFQTEAEAKAFMKGLEMNPKCEAYGRERQ